MYDLVWNIEVRAAIFSSMPTQFPKGHSILKGSFSILCSSYRSALNLQGNQINYLQSHPGAEGSNFTYWLSPPPPPLADAPPAPDQPQTLKVSPALVLCVESEVLRIVQVPTYMDLYSRELIQTYKELSCLAGRTSLALNVHKMVVNSQ